MRIAPIKKERLVPNSMQVSPRAVAVIKIKIPRKPDNRNVVVIKKIIIDDIDLQHFIYRGSFTPRYNPEWFEKQDPKPPTSYSPCTELRHTGVWKMDTHAPIWEMLMKEWLNDKK